MTSQRVFANHYFTSLFFAVWTLSVPFAWAQQADADLSERQKNLGNRYAQLEQVFLRLSEATKSTHPRRAELLQRAVLTSQDRLLTLRFDELVQNLQRNQLTVAVDGQENMEKDLIALLQLLESENREQLREAEKAKIKQILRGLEEVIQREKQLKSQITEQQATDQAAQNRERLGNQQRDVRIQTATLRDQVELYENPTALSAPSNFGDPASDAKNEPAETGQTDEDLSATQRALRQAQRRMKSAEDKLRQQKPEGVLEDQEEAIAALLQAKAELERILRQLREEELLSTLEKLDARLERMIRDEKSIRSQTQTILSETKNEGENAANLSRPMQIQAARIASEQQTCIEDADAVILILQADGTAMALAESMLQTRFDMAEIQSQLHHAANHARIDPVALELENTVIESLEEMLAAVNNAIQDAEKRQADANNPQSPMENQMATAEEALIQLIAELRMIRSMQVRVQERTERYEKEMQALQANPDANRAELDWKNLEKKVEELTRQQNRVARILHDIQVGRIE